MKMTLQVFLFIILTSAVMLLCLMYYSSTTLITTSIDNNQKGSTLGQNFNELGISQNVSVIVNEGKVIRVKTKEFEDDKELILLISPLGRAGSSWIGEILMSTDDSVAYIYEPVMLVQKIFQVKPTDSMSDEIIADVLNCQMQQDMMKLKNAWPTIFKEMDKGCGHSCNSISDYNAKCQSSKTILVKTIRMRLSAVEDLLSKRSFQHLKVIYLARDPRAQMLSRMRTFNSTFSEINTNCQLITSTVWAFHRLSRMFPGQLYFLRFEDICQNPFGEAAKLWKFLRTDHNANLPERWKRYLILHERKIQQRGAKKVDGNPYSLYKQTSTEWYNWRKELKANSPIDIRGIEKECGGAMKYLGYLPLKSVNNIRNLSIPFLEDIDCDFLNCWSFRF